MKVLRHSCLAILLSSCTSLFYQPTSHLYNHPKRLGITFEDLWFKSSDGTDLNGWYLKNQEQLKRPRGLFVFFHGNAQNLSAHFVALGWLTKHGYDVFVPDYRGYGRSDGKAHLEGVYKDSLAILHKGWELFQRDQHKKFIVYAQSLGGTIAMRAHQDFAHKDKIDLLVLDSTFNSYKDMGWSVATKSWLTIAISPLVYLFISDEYSPKNYIPLIKTPTLVIHSKVDQVVPFKHGKLIFESLKCEKKWFWQLEKHPHIHVFAYGDRPERKNLLKLLEEV